MSKPIDKKITQARERVVGARRILERNRKNLRDPKHRTMVDPGYIRTLEQNVKLFEDELIRLVEESIKG